MSHSCRSKTEGCRAVLYASLQLCQRARREHERAIQVSGSGGLGTEWPACQASGVAWGGGLGSIPSSYPSLTPLLPVHRQQPAHGQHAPQLWDPDDRDINRSPQLLSFIRGRWWWAEWHPVCPGTLLTSVQSPCLPLHPPPASSALSPASPEAQRLLWQSMEGHRLSRRGLDAGRDPLAAIPLEALVGRAPAADAMQPGPRRNTRYRNKRQRGE